MKQYLVQYSLPYTHFVTVGVTAENEQAACAMARAAFESGDIWNDTPEMPMLQDCYEESAESDVLEFKAVEAPFPLTVLREDTMQLQVNEYRNGDLEVADSTWTVEEIQP